MEVLGSDTGDELLSIKRWFIKVEDKEEQSDHILNDCPLFEIFTCCLEVAL